jgi:hypothetical protein
MTVVIGYESSRRYTIVGIGYDRHNQILYFELVIGRNDMLPYLKSLWVVMGCCHDRLSYFELLIGRHDMFTT